MPCEYIGFKFVNINKIVWVCSKENQIILDSPGITRSKYRGYKYEVTYFQTISFPPAFFENKGGELFVNGLSLGDDINATVDENGVVHIGKFISNTFK